ncbi:YbaB/EbfC family DNA-binding protein [Actinomyces viscosus]|uniref:Uncharacterized BCR, YbaB family COG0718 n=1 Tax=Actinomyces viscosus TaxID=1656 RepID=A0A3S4Z2M5_ACTVI|nr:YbaB/EbfC family nucleoid-associated protein [Actinomyces viscosus]TFH52453.1 YbaB/EbfC family DNA-binding protein [Actinomyces viscosus]VEI17106.1 Uncharacterised BCR, YbaB family COG0718 [Actinomyces viscosus]
MSDRLVEERLSRIAEQVAQAQRNHEGTERVPEQADSLEVEGTSKGGEVTVVVDAAGRVRDVRFAAASQALSSAQLSEAVMEAIDTGRRTAATKIRAIVDRHIGVDTGLGQAMLDAYEQMAGPKVGVTRRAERSEESKKRSAPPGLVFPGM